jgi:hypothetical protein
MITEAQLRAMLTQSLNTALYASRDNNLTLFDMAVLNMLQALLLLRPKGVE